jgi:hypothetical protein
MIVLEWVDLNHHRLRMPMEVKCSPAEMEGHQICGVSAKHIDSCPRASSILAAGDDASSLT